MTKVRAPVVILLSTLGAVLLGIVVIYPLAAHSWKDLNEERAERRDYAIAGDLDQAAIVRSYLSNERKKPPLCSPSGACPKEPIYFDRASAVLRSIDSPEPRNKYELRSAERLERLIDRADQSVPAPLLTLLDRLTRVQTQNTDPVLSGIVYVGGPGELPLLGGPVSCTEAYSPRLARISRAAVYKSGNLAVALVTITFCDGSGGFRVARFRHDEDGWHFTEEHRV